ncbi:uncharacterized protein AB675_4507 [Cyphellophora attinorum]|uniref:Uncharacterized protein n=1 Tax=Cyphellophora attinorum TaxID=1664694 RepID=A0A0N1H9Y5_9EURO|nr:uncharacterized protein AB675_4507 [Phialophora attinorum]KPI39175.1 hypothetical protein AB675_4507 [Phialophora attinorum]
MTPSLITLPVEIRDPPNLITLPVEIRNVIWKYTMIDTIKVCGSACDVNGHRAETFHDETAVVKGIKNPRTRLLLVCRTAYHEVLSLKSTYTLNLCPRISVDYVIRSSLLAREDRLWWTAQWVIENISYICCDACIFPDEAKLIHQDGNMRALLGRLQRRSNLRFASLLQWFDIDMTLLSTKGQTLEDISTGSKFDMAIIGVGIVLKGLRSHAS